MLNQRNIIIILIFLIFAGAFSWWLGFREYEQHDTIDIHNFPRAVDGWDSEELTLTEEEYAILETHNVFVRRYKKNGQMVEMLIVYSQTNRKVSHPPEICYTGSGLTILNKEPTMINVDSLKLVIPANKLLLEKRDSHEIALYWFKVGQTFTANYWKQQALIAIHTLINKPASSALIRLSTAISGKGDDMDVERANATIHEFIQSVTPLFPKYLP